MNNIYVIAYQQTLTSELRVIGYFTTRFKADQYATRLQVADKAHICMVVPVTVIDRSVSNKL